MKNPLYYKIIITILITVFASSVSAKDLKEEKAPKDLSPGLDHLAKLISPDSCENFDLNKIGPIVKFIQSKKPESSLYYPEKKFNATPVYYEFDIQADLEHIIKYSYNPKIPAEALMPASLRSSTWRNAKNENNSPAIFWNSFQKLDSPVIVNGIEHTVITPDTHTGSYYGYDQNRKLILCEHDGKKLFISLSKQIDRSEVGKKGLVLGSDDDWNYFYSGKKGTNLPGLGWVSAYMYDSCTIMLYYEIDAEKPLVRCAVFKWLRAGWSNINMVKKSHIYDGLVRHENNFKEIIEHPLLPRSEALENIFAGFNKQTIDELRKQTKEYFCYLTSRYKNNKNLIKTRFNKLLMDENFLSKMTKQEMTSILSIEYIKSILGKEHKNKDLLTKISK